MKYAVDRQIHIDDFRQSYTQQWEEQSFSCFTEVAIFHGWPPDDGGRINGIISMSDAGHMKNRIIVGERVKAGVVAKRTLPTKLLGGSDVALDDDIRIGRDLDIDRDAFYQFNAFLAQKTGEQDFIDLIGQRRSGGINHRRVAAQASRELKPAGMFFLALIMARAYFMGMPMHARSARIEHLHAVKTDVSRAFEWIFRENHRQRDERTGVTRPAG